MGCKSLTYEILELVEAELNRAESLHPDWPSDPVHASHNVQEESGELAQAVNNYYYHSGSLMAARTEAVETIATAIRFIYNIERYERNGQV